jgi:hypothetical protein
MGWSYLPGVQLSPERFQTEEWWLSFLAATFLVDELSYFEPTERKDVVKGDMEGTRSMFVIVKSTEKELDIIKTSRITMGDVARHD